MRRETYPDAPVNQPSGESWILNYGSEMEGEPCGTEKCNCGCANTVPSLSVIECKAE